MIMIHMLMLSTACHDSLLNTVTAYKIENELTYYELFNQLDCNKDKCIDSDELNTFMRDIGIPWRCRWPNKVIKYFEYENHSNCIYWNSFKHKIREA